MDPVRNSVSIKISSEGKLLSKSMEISNGVEEKFTEKDYYLHPFPYQESLKALEEELKMLEKSGKKTLWFYSGEETFKRLKKGESWLKEGRTGEVSLTPYDVNNIVYVLLKKLER